MSVIVSTKLQALKPILADQDITVVRQSDIATSFKQATDEKYDNQHVPSTKLFVDQLSGLSAHTSTLSTAIQTFDETLSATNAQLSDVQDATTEISCVRLSNVNDSISVICCEISNVISGIFDLSSCICTDIFIPLQAISDDIYSENGISAKVIDLSNVISSIIISEIPEISDIYQKIDIISNDVNCISSTIDDIISVQQQLSDNMLTSVSQLCTLTDAHSIIIDSLTDSLTVAQSDIANIVNDINTIKEKLKDIDTLQTETEIIERNITDINSKIDVISAKYALSSDVKMKFNDIDTSIQNITANYATNVSLNEKCNEINSRIVGLTSTYCTLTEANACSSRIKLSIDNITGSYATLQYVDNEVCAICQKFDDLSAEYTTLEQTEYVASELQSEIESLSNNIGTKEYVDSRIDEVNDNLNSAKTQILIISSKQNNLSADFKQLSSNTQSTLNETTRKVEELSQKIITVYRPKGSCTWEQLLSKIDSEVGDVWNVTDKDNANYVRLDSGSYSSPDGWDSLGKEFDLKDYAQIGKATDDITCNTLYGVRNLADSKVPICHTQSGTNCRISFNEYGLVVSADPLLSDDIPYFDADKIAYGTIGADRLYAANAGFRVKGEGTKGRATYDKSYINFCDSTDNPSIASRYGIVGVEVNHDQCRMSIVAHKNVNDDQTDAEIAVYNTNAEKYATCPIPENRFSYELSDSNVIPTIGWINQKFVVCDSLPENPTDGVFYFVTED